MKLEAREQIDGTIDIYALAEEAATMDLYLFTAKVINPGNAVVSDSQLSNLRVDVQAIVRAVNAKE